MFKLIKKLMTPTKSVALAVTAGRPITVPYCDTEKAVADWEALLRGSQPQRPSPRFRGRDFLAEISYAESHKRVPN